VEVDRWTTKEEFEALEAEINPESLVLTTVTEQQQPPPILVLPLLPYQKEFLAWGVKQELGPMRGGVLAGA
jgi:DNA repair protein RAD16